MKTAPILIAQAKALADLSGEIAAYVEKHARDGLDYMELETIDSAVNAIIKQAHSVLAAIGEPLKEERRQRSRG